VKSRRNNKSDIFRALADFIKPHLDLEKPILNLLPLWMSKRLKENPSRDNVTNILQAEFKLQELKAKSLFIIVPKSCQAKNLLKLLQEYIQLMESIRFSRWVSKVEPKDFNKHIKDLDFDQK